MKYHLPSWNVWHCKGYDLLRFHMDWRPLEFLFLHWNIKAIPSRSWLFVIIKQENIWADSTNDDHDLRFLDLGKNIYIRSLENTIYSFSWIQTDNRQNNNIPFSSFFNSHFFSYFAKISFMCTAISKVDLRISMPSIRQSYIRSMYLSLSN